MIRGLGARILVTFGWEDKPGSHFLRRRISFKNANDPRAQSMSNTASLFYHVDCDASSELRWINALVYYFTISTLCFPTWRRSFKRLVTNIVHARAEVRILVELNPSRTCNAYEKTD